MSGTPLLDEEQAARLLSLLDGEDVQYRTMIKMFMFTGMRREELCGLEWKDIDFKTSVIRIERASLYIPHEGIITDTTKNDSSTRYIKAPAIAIQLLKEYKRWQAQKRLSMGDRWVDCDRLFTKPDGMPIHPDTIGCWFRDFIRAHDLPDISIHSLRHPYVKLKTKKFEDFYYESRRTDFTLPPALALWLVRCQKVIANVIYLNTIVLEDIYTAYQAVRK